jgi:hypothetical protein
MREKALIGTLFVYSDSKCDTVELPNETFYPQAAKYGVESCGRFFQYWYQHVSDYLWAIGMTPSWQDSGLCEMMSAML